MVSRYFQMMSLFRRDVWLIIITWALMGFAYSGIFLVLFNLYLLRLGYGLEFISLVNGVGLISMALFSLPAGTLGRRWGSRRMMIAGMGLMTAGFFAVPLAEFFPTSWQKGWILATLSLIFLSAPLFLVNSPPFLMGVTSPVERDYAFSMQMALFSLAGFAGGLLAGFLPGFLSVILEIPLDQPAPFRYSLFLAGAIYFVGLLTTIATREGKVEQEKGNVSKAAGHIPLALISVMGVVMFLRMAGDWAPNIFLNVYLEMALFASPALIGALVAIGRLMAGIAALSMPLFVNHWGKERVIGWGTIGIALSLLPLALIPHWVAAEIGFIGAIVLSTIVSAAYSVFGQELVTPGWQAVMAGVIGMGSGLGGSFIVILGGRIITAFGYDRFFLTATLLTAAGGLLFLGYFRKPRGEFVRSPAREPAD